MNDEDLLQQLESAANFMRGMHFDLRIPSDARQALLERAKEIDGVIEKIIDSSM